MIFVPDVNKTAAMPSAAHALGSAGAMGPWGSPKAHLEFPRDDPATAAPGRLRVHSKRRFSAKKITGVLEGRSMSRLDRTAKETGHVCSVICFEGTRARIWHAHLVAIVGFSVNHLLILNKSAIGQLNVEVSTEAGGKVNLQLSSRHS